KLVNADLITSVPGVKGGFKLKKNPEEIRVYDIYLAIEGQQSLYSPSSILDGMHDLDEEDRCCLLADLMDEEEKDEKTVLKRETVTSLSNEVYADRYQVQVKELQAWLNEKMVV